MFSANLRAEGVPENKIAFVGNIMIDTLEENREKAIQHSLETIIINNLLANDSFANNTPKEGKFALMTLHRPSNVDSLEVFEPLVNFLLDEVTKD